MSACGFDGGEPECREVRIVGSELLVENYTVYVIEVTVGKHQWTVKHRYSDFHELHEKLTAEKKIDKNLLPPKKIIGKNSKSLVEKRQKELEVYLQTLLTKFPVVVPKVLSYFLHFHLYEINGITAALAEELFHKGEQLLVVGQVFSIRPLQLYAITQQLRLAKPTCANGDAKTDLGHVLDFTCRLRYLKITGTRGPVGTSNIQEHLLPFDLSVFKSLLQIEISQCDAKQIQGLPSLKQALVTMSVRFSTRSMKDVLVPEALEFEQWEAEGIASDCPVTAVVPVWRVLTTLDMSNNHISTIDESVKLIPKVEFLDLSHNEISLVENLQHLYNLIHLDLSCNKLTSLEGVHAKLGNIKTLILAGNQLESLSGLNKLYSLVNLDLSSNKIAQIEEIKNIGSLPCLERVVLSNNPLSIIPDYRTKVLALFGDRASEVCLDNTPTTEKELDTVEVLKAIQKAKEAKNRMNNSDKKISEDPRLTAVSSKTNCSFAARPSSSSLPCPASSSQDVVYNNPALANSLLFNNTLTPTFPTTAQRCYDTQRPAYESPNLASHMKPLDGNGSNLHMSFDHLEEENIENLDLKMMTVLPFSCTSYTSNNLEFTAQLSVLIKRASQCPDDAPPQASANKRNPSGDSRAADIDDGYFEMGLGEGDQNLIYSVTSDPVCVSSENLQSECIEIAELLWGFCVQVSKGLRLFAACFVLTDSAITVFQLPHFEYKESMQGVFADLKVVHCLPYSDLSEVGFRIPETCMSLKTKNGATLMYILSDTHRLKDFYSALCLFHSKCSMPMISNSSLYPGEMTLPEFISQLSGSHHFSLNDIEMKSCFPVYLINRQQSKSWDQNVPSEMEPPNNNSSAERSLYSDIFSAVYEMDEHFGPMYVPCLVLLTAQHLHIIKVDFNTIAGEGSESEGVSSALKINEVPISSVLLYPCSNGQQMGAFMDGHVLQLLIGYQLVTVVFVLPHEKFHFLRVYSLLRTSLQDVKTIVVLKTSKHVGSLRKCSWESADQSLQTDSTPSPSRPQLTLPSLYPSEPLLQKLTEENQCPFYLSSSPSLQYVAGLKSGALVELFHNSVAEVENEELRHLMWSSVVFYKTPDVEVTACIMLSTKGVYFVLDDSVAQFNDRSSIWNQKPLNYEKSSFHLSCCFVLKLNDLLSVNVGLFDQFFRIAGPSADHIITCLTRDSYSTHTFLQQLMAVLSLMARTPSPEPIETDFYSEFGKKSKDKMCGTAKSCDLPYWKLAVWTCMYLLCTHSGLIHKTTSSYSFC
nr:PREDICTED: nischarin isoform X3 [Latimeria chalumnae]|eukprot:XP_014344313.1 PREDICTED: nischarin isoform X3 [Latimeria chalumnae]